MSVKTKIKNDLWMINYIIPHTVKYLQAGKVNYVKKALPVILRLKVVRGRGPQNLASCSVALMEKIDLHMPKNGAFFYWLDENRTIAVPGNILGNFTLDYGKVIEGSYEQLADRAVGAGGAYGERAKLTQESIHILRDRCLETIRDECSDGALRELLMDEFMHLLERPAEHFHEGLQRILFFNQYLWQTRHKLNGLGRLDKMLDRLYRKDIKDGAITEEQAYQYICDFLRVLHEWYEFKSSALLGDIGQIIILGGTENDGTYFCNRLTELFLRAQAEVKQPDPKTLLRVSSQTPDSLLRIAVECLTAKTGSPLFSNDDVVIPRLEQLGIPREYAVRYCVSACWEPFIPGLSLDQNNIQSFDFLRPLDDVLSSNDVGQIASFEELLGRYDDALKRQWDKSLMELDQFVWALDPFVSMFTEDCTDRGLDVSEGGARYSNYGITTVGMGSVCDSLLNLRELVFDRGEYTLEELCQIRAKNFKGRSEVLAQLRNAPKHFAHDESAAVDLVNHITSRSDETVSKYKNPLGGYAKFGLSSPGYLKDGKKAPADFAGRVSGDPYGTHISASDVSYTELVRFAGKLDYAGRCMNGNVVDFFVTPNLIEDHTEQFVQYIKAAIRLGFFQMQMNVLDSKTLIDAKENPERYPGLIVRVWGFSAYFKDLPVEYQDLLIERALANEAVSN